MNVSAESSVRSFLLEFFEEQLTLKGLSTNDISDDFDLLTQGVIDSLGFLEMTVALQETFDIELDFDEIDPEKLSIMGPLCRYVDQKKSEKFSTASANFL